MHSKAEMLLCFGLIGSGELHTGADRSLVSPLILIFSLHIAIMCPLIGCGASA